MLRVAHRTLRYPDELDERAIALAEQLADDPQLMRRTGTPPTVSDVMRCALEMGIERLERRAARQGKH